MPELTEQDEIEVISPEKAFSLLGHETRVDIIQALWQTGNESVSFSELRELADVGDSGQFNYHLGELIGTFVGREGEGYELTYAGRKVVGAILDGTYTKRASIAPFEIGIPCFTCGSPLEASYENEAFVVECPNCEVKSQSDFPPGALNGRTRKELIETFGHWIRAQFSLIVNGICPNCVGIMTHSIDADVEYPHHEVAVEFDCERCTHRATSTVGWCLYYHPAAISFYDDHGIDLTEEWISRLGALDQSTTVLSESPWRIGVTIPLEDDELELVVDGELNVVERHRT